MPHHSESDRREGQKSRRQGTKPPFADIAQRGNTKNENCSPGLVEMKASGNLSVVAGVSNCAKNNGDVLVDTERCGAANQHSNAWNSWEFQNLPNPFPHQGMVVEPSPDTRWGNPYFDQKFSCERCDAANQCLYASNRVEFPNLPGSLPHQRIEVRPSLNTRCGNTCFDPSVDSEKCGAANQHSNASNSMKFPNPPSLLPDQGSSAGANRLANHQNNPKAQSDPLPQGCQYVSHTQPLEQGSKRIDIYSPTYPFCRGALYYNPLYFCSTCDHEHQRIKMLCFKQFLEKLCSPIPDQKMNTEAVQQSYLQPRVRLVTFPTNAPIYDGKINGSFRYLSPNYENG